MTVSFIGAGKMATAIAKGLLDKKIFSAHEILASDTSKRARTTFTGQTKIDCLENNIDVVNNGDVVILAIKPQNAEDILKPLNGLFSSKLLISIVAGLTIEKLKVWSGSERIIRVMPNTPTMVGMGTSVFTCAAGVTVEDRKTINRLLSSVGIVKELDEIKLDVVTGLSGSGPAYVFEFVHSLVEGAVAMGLDYGTALELMTQTVAGSAEMLRQKIATPEELRNAVTSPGGTTAAGLKVLDEANFRHLMENVVKSATERSVELR